MTTEVQGIEIGGLEAAVPTNVLDSSARVINDHLDGVYDVSELRGLARAEKEQQGRSGVLNSIQNRIGKLMVEDDSDTMTVSSTMAEAMAVSDASVTVEDLVQMEGNADIKDQSFVQGGSIEHTTARIVRLYAPSDMGWLPRPIPITNVRMCIKNGMRTHCPDCGRNNCMANGDMNDCPVRAKRAFARCPVCAKKVYDPLGTAQFAEPDEDEAEIVIDRYANLSPKARIEAKLDAHLSAWHPQEGRAYGVRPPSDPPVRAPVVRSEPDASV